jgi:hypothetical protein
MIGSHSKVIALLKSESQTIPAAFIYYQIMMKGFNLLHSEQDFTVFWFNTTKILKQFRI